MIISFGRCIERLRVGRFELGPLGSARTKRDKSDLALDLGSGELGQ